MREIRRRYVEHALVLALSELQPMGACVGSAGGADADANTGVADGADGSATSSSSSSSSSARPIGAANGRALPASASWASAPSGAQDAVRIASAAHAVRFCAPGLAGG